MVRNAVFESFTLVDVGSGIRIDQSYCPTTQRPEGCLEDDLHQGIEIRNVTFANFRGSVRGEVQDADCRHCENVTFAEINLSKTFPAFRARPVLARPFRPFRPFRKW